MGSAHRASTAHQPPEAREKEGMEKDRTEPG
jgi:hypothetical protein